MSSNDNPVLASVGLMGGGLLVFWLGFKILKKKRLIENIPTSKIRSMAMGQVEVKGTVLDWKTYRAPFTEKECVYYEYKIEKWVHGNKRNYWKTIHQGDTREAPFYLQDETGQAIVYPDGADFSLPADYKYVTSSFTGIPGHIVEFLDARGVSYRGIFGGSKKLRFTETHIAPGDFVYILGVCQDNRTNIALGFQHKLSSAIQKVKEDPELMKKYDRNNDGNISPLEWEIAMRSIADDVKATPDEQDEHEVFIGRGSNKGELFVISDQEESDLVKGLKWRSFAGVFGGAALFLVGLWLFLTKGLEYLGYTL